MARAVLRIPDEHPPCTNAMTNNDPYSTLLSHAAAATLNRQLHIASTFPDVFGPVDINLAEGWARCLSSERTMPIQVLGSEARNAAGKRTWLWGWANRSLPPQVTELSRAFLDLCQSGGDRTNPFAPIAMLQESELELDEHDRTQTGPAFAALCVFAFNAPGFLRIENGDACIYLSVHDETLFEGPSPIPTAAIVARFPTILDASFAPPEQGGIAIPDPVQALYALCDHFDIDCEAMGDGRFAITGPDGEADALLNDEGISFTLRGPATVQDENGNVSDFVGADGLNLEDDVRKHEAIVAAMGPVGEAAAAVNEAAGLLVRQDFDAAIDAYSAIAERYPEKRATAFSQIGAAWFFKNEFARAIQFYQLALREGASADMMRDNIEEATAALAASGNMHVTAERDPTQHRTGEPDPSGLARRERTRAELNAQGFQFSSALPTTLHRAGIGAALRPQEEIAQRLLALQALNLWVFAQQQPDQTVLDYVAQNELGRGLTSDEQAILSTPRSAAFERYAGRMGWTQENMWPLAWILGFEMKPTPFHGLIDDAVVGPMIGAMPALDGSLQAFLEQAQTRSDDDVLDLEDLFYAAHNSARAAQIGHPGAVPPGFDPARNGGAIHERRHGLTWAVSPGIAWPDTDLSS